MMLSVLTLKILRIFFSGRTKKIILALNLDFGHFVGSEPKILILIQALCVITPPVAQRTTTLYSGQLI